MKLKIDQLAKKLNDALEENTLFGEDRLYISQLIYQIEASIAEIKEVKKLPSYNQTIYSDRITRSFKDRGDEFTREYPHIIRAFTKTDYQYYLLIYLLLNYSKLRVKKLTLYEIIDMFVELHKARSLTFDDIQLTASGATRCKTNLRFAFMGLKEMGLVKLYNRDEKEKSWMLTYLGLMVATSIVMHPDPERPKEVNSGMRHCRDSNYFAIDRWIFERIEQLTEPAFYHEVIDSIAPIFYDHETFGKGLDALREYAHFFRNIPYQLTSPQKIKERTEFFQAFLDDFEKRHLLDKFMNELSGRLDSEMFLDSVRRILDR